MAFYPQYLLRVLAEIPEANGIAFLHGHPKPGWQGMSMTTSARSAIAWPARLPGVRVCRSSG